jgi:hypothetical protein
VSDKFREALFNEIKGSLFEYLVALEFARRAGLEASFLRSLPTHYQRVLEQQDHMTREAYPELLPHLPLWAKQVVDGWQQRFPGEKITAIGLTGQLTHTEASETQGEADFTVTTDRLRSVSLKLNKRQGAVNTKSGGIKSFFTTYFSDADVAATQERFNRLVDAEFSVMRLELHQIAGLAEERDWASWKRAGLSELPGELPVDMRERLHAFYARVSLAVREALESIEQQNRAVFEAGLLRLCGFGMPDLVQVIAFHEIHGKHPAQLQVQIHDAAAVLSRLQQKVWRPNADSASCELDLRDWLLQIRVKPMNKFTTTAIKMNCSVRY